MESLPALSNAIGSVRRALQELKAHVVILSATKDPSGLLEAADNIARRGLTLEAYMRNKPQRYALSEIAPFGKRVDEAMKTL